MADFDVSKPWAVLIPPNIPAAKQGAEDLARLIDLLRRQSGLSPAAALAVPAVTDGSPQEDPAGGSVPGIICNCHSTEVGPRDAGSPAPLSRDGFAWRAASDRVEIFGNSPHGLVRGIYHFLDALGIHWPGPDREELPRPNPEAPGIYPLGESSACQMDETDPAKRRRLLFTGQARRREALICWAARKGYDALVFPLRTRRGTRDRTLAAKYALDIEAGGRELSALVPRNLFFLRPGLFRMEGGRRKRRGFFCATNPETLALIRKNAARLFRRTGAEVRIFHLWPGEDSLHCACPSCRAFSPEEQYRIALSTAADALAGIRPGALLSCYESSSETGEAENPAPRPNTFRISALPENA